MASRKERRKLIRRKQELAAPAGPRKPRDGDRRRRGGPNADEATRHKEFVRTHLGLPTVE